MSIRTYGAAITRTRFGAIGVTLACALGCSSDPGAPGGTDAATDAVVAPPDAELLPSVGPEVDGRLVINELMAANALTVLDQGNAGDWIELYNPTTVDIPLGGYGLTNDLSVPRKAVLIAGLIAPAGGHLLIWLDGQPERGVDHVGLDLMIQGGAIGFVRPDSSFIDRVEYGAQAIDFSAAREPDGSDAWRVEWHASPGAANPAGDGVAVGPEPLGVPPEQVPAAGDLSERLLAYDLIPEFALTVAPADVAKLELDPFTYVPATLTFEGRAYGPVGVRAKGANSFQPFSQKPSLRINVDEFVPGARFFGQGDLTLNNMDDDPSMMHERLAYFVAREAGIVASRSNHALLTVNGESYGLYANVEPVKRPMLRRWFVDDTGPLFEATDVDFQAAYVDRYELESGPDDRSLLIGLSSALTLASADEAIAAASAFVDLEQFQRYWGMAAVIGQLDAFPYSLPGDDYRLYADPLSDRLHFIPWGMDETFFSAVSDVTAVQSVLATKCMASTACFQAFVDQAWSVLAMTESLDLVAERARVAAQIAPLVAADTRKAYTTQFVIDNQAAQYWFIYERRMWLTLMLPPPSP